MSSSTTSSRLGDRQGSLVAEKGDGMLCHTCSGRSPPLNHQVQDLDDPAPHWAVAKRPVAVEVVVNTTEQGLVPQSALQQQEVDRAHARVALSCVSIHSLHLTIHQEHMIIDKRNGIPGSYTGLEA